MAMGGKALLEVLPEFADEVFNRGASGLGELTAVSGVGGLVAAIWLARRGHVRGLTRVTILALLATGIGIFGFGAASTVMVGVHFGAGQIKRGHTVGWIGAFYAAGLTGLIGCVAAVFPGIWAESFTEVLAVQEVCRSYLQVVGPFYAFFGLGLCFYFASQGAGRVLWPVLSVVVRFAIVVGGGFILISLETTTPDNFFLLIGIGMLAQAIFTAVPIQMGAWTRGLDAQKH